MTRIWAQALALLSVASAGAAQADAVTAAIEQALSAYRAGDLKAAREDLDHAVKLLAEGKTDELAALLPAAPTGWTREETSAGGAGIAMAVFGGGTAAAALYRRGSAEVTLTLVADAPMIGAISAMVSGMASLAGVGTRLIGRTTFATVAEGGLQGVVDGRVLVSATGSAPVEAKAEIVGALDQEKLAAF